MYVHAYVLIGRGAAVLLYKWDIQHPLSRRMASQTPLLDNLTLPFVRDSGVELIFLCRCVLNPDVLLCVTDDQLEWSH